MLNTPFKEGDADTQKEMTKLWTQIFAVCMNQNLPMVKTIVWLNENFEDIYWKSDTEVQVYEKIFDELGVLYKYNDKNK
jgi:hypothetical protein